MTLLIISITVIGLLIFLLGWKSAGPRKTHATHRHLSDYDEEITIHYSDGTTSKYVGECTVWHSLPSYKRCGTMQESFLSDLWTYFKHNKEPYQFK